MQVMIKYANERKAFGKPLHNFGQIQAHIGKSYADVCSVPPFVSHQFSTWLPNLMYIK